MSDDSCFNLIAAARPEGPAPTTTTSNSIDSRAGKSITNLHAAGLTRAPFFHVWRTAAISAHATV
jgi:hypothetical protein